MNDFSLYELSSVLVFIFCIVLYVTEKARRAAVQNILEQHDCISEKCKLKTTD